MITVEEAFAAYEREIAPLGVETIPVADALHRVLAEDGRSRVDLPPFPQSAMDGYAVRAAELSAAAGAAPVRLPVVATVAATGLDEIPTLAPGTCARIFTGGHVPTGATAVVMQEKVERDGDFASFTAPTEPGKDIRDRAEEVAAGATVCDAGARLTPGRIGALAAAGVGRVIVRRAPRVRVLVSGDEVVAADAELRPGEVFDCNTPMVASWLRARGLADVTVSPIPDVEAEVAAFVAAALDDADLVITTGGVSGGDKDFIIGAARAAGVRDVFWKVAQKPGKPVYFGRRDDACLLGLPGNPAAVFVGLVAHASRVLDRLEGADRIGPALLPGCLASRAKRSSGRDVWFRCRATPGDDGLVRLSALTGQASHMLSNLSECTALVLIPSGEGWLEPGASVFWSPI